MKRILCFCVLLVATPAYAQPAPAQPAPSDFGLRFIRPTVHPKTGDDALDRAMSICDKHLVRPTSVTDSAPVPKWQDGYEACANVQTKWDKSESARQAQAAQQKAADDKTFLEHYGSE